MKQVAGANSSGGVDPLTDMLLAAAAAAAAPVTPHNSPVHRCISDAAATNGPASIGLQVRIRVHAQSIKSFQRPHTPLPPLPQPGRLRLPESKPLSWSLSTHMLPAVMSLVSMASTKFVICNTLMAPCQMVPC